MPATLPAPITAPAIQPYGMLALGGSAGAIPVLRHILSLLPPWLPVPIVVVQHLNAEWRSRLPTVLGFRTFMQCKWAEDGERPAPGVIHVAPPGANLVLASNGCFRQLTGPKPRMGWPSVDAFFCSMADRFGQEAIGVVLSGMLYDGAEGIAAVRKAGGATMVQQPSTASARSMPEAAIDLGRADIARSPNQIAEAISILIERGVE